MENGDNGNTFPLSVGRVTSQYLRNNEKYFPIIKGMNVACHFFIDQLWNQKERQSKERIQVESKGRQ